MINKNNRNNGNNDSGNNFITIQEIRNRLEVFIKGSFGDPEDYAKELIELENLSDDYDTVYIHINSPGGRIHLLTEMISIFKKFENIITVGSGELASAGAMLWSIGDVRVLRPYTDFMIHRESYGISHLKTKQHADLAEHNQKIYTSLISDLFSDMLTDEEINKMEYTELYLTTDELIERGCAISYEQFLDQDNSDMSISILFVADNGVTFLKNTDGTVSVVEEFETGPSMKECYAKYVVLNEVDEILEKNRESGKNYRKCGSRDTSRRYRSMSTNERRVRTHYLS